MAKLLGKEEAIYSKEKEAFLRELHHFHEIRGTSFKRCPTVGSREVDLYLLYSLVTAQGGWIKVNHRNAWEEILPIFKLPRSCVNSTVAIKQIYLRYLDRYEKSHFLGEDPDRDQEDDDESRHKRWNARSLHAVPHTYNYAQHVVADDKREYNLLEANIYKPSDYDRLALSLISPLPNEQDFAINVCTLLSNDGKHTLKLEKHPRIVDYLLAHAGVFNHGSLRKLFMHFYKEIRRKPIHNFWTDVLESDEHLDLTNEAKFYTQQKGMEEKRFSDSILRDDYQLQLEGAKEKDSSSDIVECESECEMIDEVTSLPISFRFTPSDSDRELFCIPRTLGTQDYIGQRVLQIATILRNLCFIEENLPTLVKNRTFLRFLLLCSTSQWNMLRNLGLDMLCNIASEFEIHDLTNDVLSAKLLKIVSKNLQSDDRASCLASIEVLNKLSQNDSNEDMLLRCLEADVYQKVCSFLTIHDVMLLIYTLECLYALSSLGERSCNFIAYNHGVIDTLVSLVTVEGKSYGPRACIGLDMLCNIASEFEIHDLTNDVLSAKLLKIVSKNLQSDDRASCLASIEVLNKLSQNDSNEDMLLRCLEADVYQKNVYALSSLGERSCNFIAYNHGVIDTLASLVTVEGKSYGPRACIGMKLVETVPSSHHQQLMQQQPQTQQSNTTQKTSSSSTPATTTQQPATTSVATSSSNTVTVSTSVASPAAPSVTPVKNQPSTPMRQVVQIVPKVLASGTTTSTQPTVTTTIKTEITKPTTTSVTKPAVSTTPSTTTAPTLPPPLTPQQMIQQQHAQQQAIHENEQFALAWLRATYEPALGRVDHQEVYKHYINYCAKIGRKGVISPLHFPRCVRSIFGGTVGPNPIKPAKPTDPQWYDGIKVRDKPLLIKIPPPLTPPQIQESASSNLSSSSFSTGSGAASKQAKGGNRRGNKQQSKQTQQAAVSVPLDIDPAMQDLEAVIPCSPISPILKAQLSQPPKPSSKDAVVDSNHPTNHSQAIAHPHLSQALLSAGFTTSSSSSSTSTSIVAASTTLTSMTTVAPTASIKEIIVINKSCAKDAATVEVVQPGVSAALGGGMAAQSSSSMIKSLLATKVTDACAGSAVVAGMKAAFSDDAQVAARQQRLLAQQSSTTVQESNPPPQKVFTKTETLRMQRINGARNLFQDNEVGDNSVSSTTHIVSTLKGKKEPPQPPPPLAPLSNNRSGILSEDSVDSIGTISLSSGLGTVGVSTVSSTEDNDNSLTSFECLLNGIPNSSDELITLHGAEDSDSKDSVKLLPSEITMNKPLRLADLLEKKFEKSPPLLNGTMGKDNKHDLVENHIEKALSTKTDDRRSEAEFTMIEPKTGLKRPATDHIDLTVEAKRPHLSNVNGSASAQPDSSSNGDDGPSNVSSAAAKLFADMAADILGDEDEDQLMQAEAPATTATSTTQTVIDPSAIQQQLQQQQQQQPIIMSDSNQLMVAQPRQIIVSQGQQTQTTQQIVLAGGAQLAKTQSGQTVIVQSAGGSQQTRQVVIQQSPLTNAGGQIVLSQGIQGLQGGVQFVTSAQGGQYVLQTGGNQGIVLSQQQTAMVHGQPQTILLGQNHQAGGPKTIIIVQQQSNNPQHHQKVVVTPQGQQVVVTQVPRPVAQTSTVSNSIHQGPKKVIRMANSPATTVIQQQAASNGLEEVVDIKPKPRILRDLTSPYVCEWGDCDIKAKFRSVNEVFMHCVKTHIPQGNEELTCLWDRCDNIKRRRFSLMTHVQDKHCIMETMKQALIRRKQASQGILVEQPQTSSAQPVYAPDAALHAIKRHAMEFINPKELQDDNEGPVTKSIRLTASLILRNLVIYSSYSKRYLKSYESHLANVALSNVESSRTVAQILYDINEGNAPR